MAEGDLPQITAALALEDALAAVASPLRWRILAALVGGETLMVTEIAERVGVPPNAVSKNLAVLRKTGLVTVGRNKLYKLAPQLTVDREAKTLDLGYFVLRLRHAHA